MNIAHLLPASIRFPLPQHNGRYDWVLRLAGMQVAAGHDVTIYCASGSEYPAVPDLHWASLPGAAVPAERSSSALLHRALNTGEHDVFHSHFDSLHYAVADATDKPIVVTQHWFPDPNIAAMVKLNSKRNVIAVPVTRYMQAEDIRLGIPCSEVIYHGIDLSLFKPAEYPRSERLLFVGRICPQKGVREAVDFALATNQQLDIVGKVNAKDTAYWENILPLVDGSRIHYLGPKAQPQVARLMSQAKGMLFLPQITEAFGQTIIEAQACGTPVIVNDTGANAELITAGKTGYVLDAAQDPAQAIVQLSLLNAEDCRDFAVKFDMHRMHKAYMALYENLVLKGSNMVVRQIDDSPDEQHQTD